MQPADHRDISLHQWPDTARAEPLRQGRHSPEMIADSAGLRSCRGSLRKPTGLPPNAKTGSVVWQLSPLRSLCTTLGTWRHGHAAHERCRPRTQLQLLQRQLKASRVLLFLHDLTSIDNSVFFVCAYCKARRACRCRCKALIRCVLLSLVQPDTSAGFSGRPLPAHGQQSTQHGVAPRQQRPLQRERRGHSRSDGAALLGVQLAAAMQPQRWMARRSTGRRLPPAQASPLLMRMMAAAA